MNFEIHLNKLERAMDAVYEQIWELRKELKTKDGIETSKEYLKHHRSVFQVEEDLKVTVEKPSAEDLEDNSVYDWDEPEEVDYGNMEEEFVCIDDTSIEDAKEDEDDEDAKTTDTVDAKTTEALDAKKPLMLPPKTEKPLIPIPKRVKTWMKDHERVKAEAMGPMTWEAWMEYLSAHGTALRRDAGILSWNSKKGKCVFCNTEGDHESALCPEVWTLEQRKAVIRQAGFCSRCLKKKHGSSCHGFVKCFCCPASAFTYTIYHHTFLCHKILDALRWQKLVNVLATMEDNFRPQDRF